MAQNWLNDGVVNDIRVASWNELHERLYEGAWNGTLRRFRSRFAFRGMADARCDLRTSLARLGGPYHELERHLLPNLGDDPPRPLAQVAALSVVEDDLTDRCRA